MGPFVVLILWIASRNYETALFYAPTPDECRAIAPSCAILFPKVEKLFHLPDAVHTGLVNIDQITLLGTVVVGYLDRTNILEKIAPATTKVVDRLRVPNNGKTFVREKPGTGTHSPVSTSSGLNGYTPSAAPVASPVSQWGLGGQNHPE